MNNDTFNEMLDAVDDTLVVEISTGVGKTANYRESMAAHNAAIETVDELMSMRWRVERICYNNKRPLSIVDPLTNEPIRVQQ